MDSVTAQIIMEGFQHIESSLVALKKELRMHSGYSSHPLCEETDRAFEGLRSYMHDGPELSEDDERAIQGS